MADLTDDIACQAPDEPEIVGKSAVRRGKDGKWRVAVDGWSSDIR